MHDARELTAVLAQLLFRLAREARVRRSAIDDEDASNRWSTKLLADLVRLVERVKGLGYSPEVEWTWLGWKRWRGTGPCSSSRRTGDSEILVAHHRAVGLPTTTRQRAERVLPDLRRLPPGRSLQLLTRPSA